MSEVLSYSPEWKTAWDTFVDASKNGTFLLRRDYMDYHSDRFLDASMMVVDPAGRIEALLPASAHGTELRSHGGLTYGGLIMSARTTAQQPLEWLPMIARRAADLGFDSLIYKPTPHIYHRLPAEEDLYAIWRMGARLSARNLSTAVLLPDAVASRLGKRARRRAERFGIVVEPTHRVEDFWQIIVDDRRVRHDAVPVHSAVEMQRLADLFPDNILMFKAVREGRTVAGAVMFVTRPDGVIHLQYAAGNAEGMETYAVDCIYHHVVFDLLPHARWFDFGTSNEDGGRYLNTGMTAHKEEFGGRSVVYDTYQIKSPFDNIC